eukprot:4470334-Prymnesium_polylepis.2
MFVDRHQHVAHTHAAARRLAAWESLADHGALHVAQRRARDETDAELAVGVLSDEQLDRVAAHLGRAVTGRGVKGLGVNGSRGKRVGEGCGAVKGRVHCVCACGGRSVAAQPQRLQRRTVSRTSEVAERIRLLAPSWSPFAIT